MYYNVDLVEECGLEDPAELWLKGEWTLSTFDEWIKKAQNVLSTKGGYALDMEFAEAIIGLTASTGNPITKVNPPTLYLNQTNKLIKLLFFKNIITVVYTMVVVFKTFLQDSLVVQLYFTMVTYGS